MKKKISAALLAFMLVFQVLSSGYMMPFTALAQEPLTTQAADDSEGLATSENEAKVEQDVANQEALKNATKLVDNLFTDASHSTIKETTVDAVINTAEVQVNLVAEGEEKTALQKLITEARTQATAKAEATKEEVVAEEPTTTEVTEEKATEVTEEKATEEAKEVVKEETKATEETKEIVKETQKKKALKTSAVEGSAITENIISVKAFTVNDNEVKDGDKIDLSSIKGDYKANITFDYKLPDNHSYTKGSTFTFQLPKQLVMYNKISEKNLDAINGISYGSFNVTQEGVVTITFNEKIQNHSDVHGTLGFSTQLIAVQTETNEQTISIEPINGGTKFTFDAIFPQTTPNGGEYSKTGSWVGSFNQKEANWTVVMNAGNKEVTNGVIKDKLPAGMEYKDGTIEVKELELLMNGKLVKTNVATTDFSYSTTENEISLTIGNTKKGYEITYTTEVVGEYKELYRNTASLLSDSAGESTTVDGSTQSKELKPTTGKVLEKKEMGLNEEQTRINWEIKFNGKESKYSSGTYLKDTLLNDSYVSNSMKMYKATVDPQGNMKKSSEEFTGFIVKNEKIKFTNDVTGALIIEYSTKVPEEFTSGQKINNTVSLNEETDVKYKAIGSYSMPEIGVKKTSSSPDYSKKEVNWTVNVTNSGGIIKKGAIITDKLGTGLSYISTSFKVKVGEEYLADDKYSLVITGDTYTITLKNEEIRSEIIVTYTTKFAVEATGKESKYNFENVVIFNYENQYSQPRTLEKTGTFTPNAETQYNGYKKGIYNKGTKRVTWTVGVNYNYKELNNVVVKDELTKKDEFTLYENSIKVLDLSNEKKELTADTDYKLTVADDKKSFSVEFLNKITTPYEIVYETTDDDQIFTGPYTNTATVNSDGKELTTLTKTVDGKDSDDKNTDFGNYVEKIGSQNKDNENYLDWTLTVNKAGSTINDFTLVDTPQGYQQLKLDSLEIKSLKDSSLLTKEKDYNLELDKTTGAFTIKFKNQISEAYKITYQTYFLAEASTNNGKLGNDVTYSGENLKTENNKQSGFASYASSDGWGTSVGRVYNLELTKKANDTEAVLAGVEFELYADEELKNLLDTGKTDNNGKLKFYRLILNKTYYLVEKTVPEGYVKPEVKKINLTTMPTDSIGKIEIVNNAEIKAVKLTKKAAGTTTKLAGVKYQLQKSDGTPFEIAGTSEFTTDENGEIYLGNTKVSDNEKMLANGKYKFVELETVVGYKLDKTPVEFEITDGKSKAVEKEAINNRCEKTVVTVIDAGKVVNGAIVTLYDKLGNPITGVDPQTTDAVGKVTFDAQYGTDEYQVKVTYGDREVTTASMKQDGNCAVQVVLDIACEHNVIIVKENGDLVENISVTVKNANGEKTVKTDSNGRAVFEPSDMVSVTKVTVDNGKREILEINPIEFNDKCQIEVDIKDQACKEIIVTVKDDQIILTNAKVQIFDKQGNLQELTEDNKTILTTNSEGKVKIPTKFADGNYEIKVEKQGYQTLIVDFNPTNCEIEVNFKVSNKQCTDYEITVLTEDGTLITDAKYGKFITDSEFTLTSTDGSVTLEKVKINTDGKLVDANGDVINKVALKGATDEYTLTQTKVAAGYVAISPTVIKDLNNCSATVTINFAKTTDATPGISCPDFTINYNGPASSQAEFKLVKVETDATTGAKTETDVTTDVKVVTDATTNKQKLEMKDSAGEVITALEAGDYKLVQTKAHAGYQTTSATFTVTEGVCQAELTVTNSPTPPPVCDRDTVITITDTEGTKIVPNDKAVVTVDGKTTNFTVEDDKVVIPKTEISKMQDTVVTITLEDGRTTTTTLSKDRVECTVDVQVPVLKLCTENPTITITTPDGKEVSTDLVEKVIVNGEETPVVTENGKVVIPKDSVNSKEDTTVIIILKDGTEGTVTIPKFTEECTFTIVVDQACDKLTVNVTNNGKAVKSGTVEILDADGKVVATAKIDSKGQAIFEAKYANSKYSAKVTVGNKNQTVKVTVDDKCAMTVNLVKACEKATVTVKVDGSAKENITVKVVDSKDKTVQKVTTDEHGVAKIDPKYVDDKHKVIVTIFEETKSYEFHDCAIHINVKPKVDVKGDNENGKTPNSKTDEDPKTPTAVNGDTETSKVPNQSVTVKGDTEETKSYNVSVPTEASPGQTYNVYDENGNLVGKNAIVGKDGKVNVKNLPAGKYKLVSTDGEKTVEFTVDKDGKLPQTGTQDFMLYTFYGLLILAAGVWLLARNRKKNA